MLDKRQRPVGDRERQVPNRVERPGIGILDRDPVARRGREGQRLVRPPRERTATVTCKVARRRAETSEVLPWGSVAVAVMIGSPAGAVNGTAKTHLPARVGRHLQRPQVVLGLARAAGP